jgi:hypothetical protein
MASTGDFGKVPHCEFSLSVFNQKLGGQICDPAATLNFIAAPFFGPILP